MGIDRLTGQLTVSKPNGETEVIETLPDEGFGNRFQKHVFPAFRQALAGEADPNYPNLEDGWRVQVFTDAVVRSTQENAWISLTDVAGA